MMDTIEEMLDTLADYKAQIDLLNMKKQELLDTVKVPDEVLKSQDEANKRRQKIDSDMWARQKEYERAKQEALAEVVDPPMPPEFVAALEAAKNKRYAIQLEYDKLIENKRKETQAQTEAINANLSKTTAGIYAEINQRKNEINAEFGDQIDAANENIAALKAQIVDGTKKAGCTQRGKFYQAVYMKGRVTWNTDMLDGMIIAFPALEKARKEGEPSVSIRAVGGK